jgi:hypothetical protein
MITRLNLTSKLKCSFKSAAQEKDLSTQDLKLKSILFTLITFGAPAKTLPHGDNRILVLKTVRHVNYKEE